MRQFKCRACGKVSNFSKSKRSMRLIVEMKRGLSSSDDETRTYKCEHCDEENEITQPAGAWSVIDLSGR